MTALGYVKVARPPLAALGVVAPVALLKWSGGLGDPLRSALVVLAVALGNVAFNMLNEVFDAPVDEINKPWKPIPSGEADPDVAARIALALFGASAAASLLLGFLFDPAYLAAACVGYVGASIYNVLGLRSVSGNLALGVTYWSAAFMSTYPSVPHVVFSVAFLLFTLAANAATQWQDLEAEKAAGVETLPMQLGDKLTGAYIAAMAGASAVMSLALFSPSALTVLFALTCSVYAASSLAVFTKRPGLIEWMCRRLGRLMLLVTFVAGALL